MIICPFCASENIEGIDTCQQCGQTLADAHITAPASELERNLLRDRIAVIKPKAPITVAPDTPVQQVLQLLVDKAIGCAFVVDKGDLVGVFTERDALMRIGVKADEIGSNPVSDFMTGNPKTLPLTAKIVFAVRMMDVGGYRHIPIVDESNQLVGAISARDILRYFAEKLSGAAV